MSNDQPMTDVPRHEYLTWALLALSAPGGADREQLSLVLREARSNLNDAEYAQLQRDLRYWGLGERVG